MIENFNNILHNVCDHSLLNVKNKKNHTKYKHAIHRKINKKWFDKDCYKMRKFIRKSANILCRNPKNKLLRNQIFKDKKKYFKLLKKKKFNYKQNILEKMYNANNKDPKIYWKLLNQLRQTEKTSVSRGGDISTSMWAKYFEELYKLPERDKWDIYIESEIKRKELLNNFNDLDFCITDNEIDRAISSLKNGKAASFDGFLSEMFKFGKATLLPILNKLFNNIFTNSDYPTSWRNSLTFPIYKKGSKSDMSNDRGISINSTVAKIFSTILNNRLVTYLLKYQILNDLQIGFVKNTRTSDHLFILRTLKEKYDKLYLCFVDFKKGYDLIWRKGLLFKLLDNDINGLFYKIIKSMYDRTECNIKNGKNFSYPIEMLCGLKQRDILSPMLFNIYINDLPEIFDQLCDPVSLGNRNISCLLYADDLVIISKTATGLQNALNQLLAYCEKWKLSINTSKTNTMFMCRNNKNCQVKFKFGTTVIKQVQNYTYLGVNINSSGSFNKA